jgi:methyl-accepting chemotaxis protein
VCRRSTGRSARRTGTSSIALIIAGIIGLALCVFVSVVTTRSIINPIRKNIETAKTLADGNLAVQVAAGRGDEFGDEAEAFRTMVDKWQRLISGVKGSAASVASASHQLSASAEQLSRGASAQVERTIQVSTASEEMSQASLDIAKSTSNISDSAKDMLTPPRRGALSIVLYEGGSSGR